MSEPTNEQNCRYWAESNPQMVQPLPLHSQRVTVWCAIYSSKINGPYFFENDYGHATTVNSNRYLTMINEFFIPEIRANNMKEYWFQQDGTTFHTANAIMAHSKQQFSNS